MDEYTEGYGKLIGNLIHKLTGISEKESDILADRLVMYKFSYLLQADDTYKFIEVRQYMVENKIDKEVFFIKGSKGYYMIPSTFIEYD